MVADLSRQHGISAQTIYNWRAKFGGLDVNVAKRLCEHEEENRQPKQRIAELSLNERELNSALSKRW